ncbi:hypothetical protein NKH77_48460 [Streptomyces sp. M19]
MSPSAHRPRPPPTIRRPSSTTSPRGSWQVSSGRATPARGQRLELRAERRAPRPRGPDPRHAGEHERQLAGRGAAPRRRRLLRLRLQLRRRRRDVADPGHRAHRGRRGHARRVRRHGTVRDRSRRGGPRGHSQGGGPLPRYYLKHTPDAGDKVGKLIGITPSNHGTTLDGLTELGSTLHVLEPINGFLDKTAPALVEQEIGSDFNKALDEGGDTVPGVDYTVIASQYDEVVTPYTNGYLTAGPGATVRNIHVQDSCAKDYTDHLEAPYDPITLTHVLNALDPAHPREVTCQTVLP